VAHPRFRSSVCWFCLALASPAYAESAQLGVTATVVNSVKVEAAIRQDGSETLVLEAPGALSISADQGTQLSQDAGSTIAVRTSNDAKLLYVTVVY
jgi:hypothetical protein